MEGGGLVGAGVNDFFYYESKFKLKLKKNIFLRGGGGGGRWVE